MRIPTGCIGLPATWKMTAALLTSWAASPAALLPLVRWKSWVASHAARQLYASLSSDNASPRTHLSTSPKEYQNNVRAHTISGVVPSEHVLLSRRSPPLDFRCAPNHRACSFCVSSLHFSSSPGHTWPGNSRMRAGEQQSNSRSPHLCFPQCPVARPCRGLCPCAALYALSPALRQSGLLD
jgi:hypothetical protein